jgi:hypothetical protein
MALSTLSEAASRDALPTEDDLLFCERHGHADRAYRGTCSSQPLLTAWISFHDIDETRAPLVVLDGSHQWSDIEHARFFNDGDLDSDCERFSAEWRTLTGVAMCLRRGQVSFHHGWTLHASYANRSAQFRVALTVRLQDGANHYQGCTTNDGQAVPMIDEALCGRLPDGRPDFSDPEIFPVLWSARGEPC